jgi:hypothetical protein
MLAAERSIGSPELGVVTTVVVGVTEVLAEYGEDDCPPMGVVGKTRGLGVYRREAR